jgi:hypothetical protein
MNYDRRDFLRIGGLAAGSLALTPAASMAMKTPDKQKVVPSKTSSEKDFDFVIGYWSVKNRMLKTRLAKSNDWVEFDSTIETRKVLQGLGNVETYKSTFNGKSFEGMAVRLYDPKARLWSVYWTDINGPSLAGDPVVGSFENGVGKLYADDNFNGKPVIQLYQWDSRDPDHPIWSQALSTDKGKTWEWNWYMTLTRIS